MWSLTRMSVIPGTANRGGATGQVQNTTFAAVVASTSAERSRRTPAPARYSQAEHQRRDDEVQQAVVVAGRLGQGRAGRGQVVQGRLDVQVQPAFGPPQLGRVRERGVTAGPDGQRRTRA